MTDEVSEGRGEARMKLQQALLDQDGTQMVAWIPADYGIRKGTVVVGKDGDEWTVAHVYDFKLDTDDLNRGWKVGGIDAPVRK